MSISHSLPSASKTSTKGYIKFWEEKRKELAKAMKTLDPANLQGIREEMDQYDRIRDKISGITAILKDMNTLTPDMHRDSEFSNLYDAIVERLKGNVTDVTGEFNELAKKADAQRKAKEEADHLASQKLEQERLTQQRVEEERLAKAETERKACEEAERLAAQKADTKRLAQQRFEEEQLAKAKAEREAKEASVASEIKAVPVAPGQKKRIPNVVMYSLVAVVLFVVLGVVYYSFTSRNKNSPASNQPVTIKATTAPAAAVPATTVKATAVNCPYQGSSDSETFKNLARAEGRANLDEDIDIIKTIFSKDAVVHAYGKSYTPISWYQAAFGRQDFVELYKYDFNIVKQTSTQAWMKYSDDGKLIITSTGEKITYWGKDDPGATHVIFQKDSSGCWLISFYSFSASGEAFP